MAKVKLKGIEDENFVNYKRPSMFLATTYCTFKCDKECGKNYCINSQLVKSPTIEVDIYRLVERYLRNPITQSIVIGGLEPFDTFDDLLNIVQSFRVCTNDDIVIYTGYYPYEITEELSALNVYPNIVIKFGRYMYDKQPRYDDVLGITLASDNQYAVKFS